MEMKPFQMYFDGLRKDLKLRGGGPKLPIDSIPSLNRKIWGLNDKLTIIGARTSCGKTAFAMQIMIDLLKAGKKVIYMGFEMTQQELMERMFAHIERIDNFQLLTGTVDNLDKKLESFQKYLKGIKFLATDNFGKNWKDINKFLDELDNPPDVIFIDYIQAISQGGGEGKVFLDDYILNFRNMCLKKGFAGVILSQLNRNSQDRKDKTPQLHDFKGTGFLEEIADSAFLLDWPGRLNGGREFNINVAKNRGSVTGYATLHYEPKYYLFTDNTEPERADVKETKVHWQD